MILKFVEWGSGDPYTILMFFWRLWVLNLGNHVLRLYRLLFTIWFWRLHMSNSAMIALPISVHQLYWKVQFQIFNLRPHLPASMFLFWDWLISVSDKINVSRMRKHLQAALIELKDHQCKLFHRLQNLWCESFMISFHFWGSFCCD